MDDQGKPVKDEKGNVVKIPEEEYRYGIKSQWNSFLKATYNDLVNVRSPRLTGLVSRLAVALTFSELF